MNYGSKWPRCTGAEPGRAPLLLGPSRRVLFVRYRLQLCIELTAVVGRVGLEVKRKKTEKKEKRKKEKSPAGSEINTSQCVALQRLNLHDAYGKLTI